MGGGGGLNHYNLLPIKFSINFKYSQDKFPPMKWLRKKVKSKVSYSLIAVGAVGVRVPLYLGHS